MGFYQGKSASIKRGATDAAEESALPMAEWTLTTKTERVELTDVRRRAARFRAGTPVAELRLSGPLPDEDGGKLGLREGHEYDVTLGFGPEGAGPDSSAAPAPKFLVRLLVDSVSVKAGVRGVLSVEVAGVVNSDFCGAPDDDPDTIGKGTGDYDKFDF